MNKYTVEYVSGATGYGWEAEYDNIEEVKELCRYFGEIYTAHIVVWDNAIKKFIFRKRCLTFIPEIDEINALN